MGDDAEYYMEQQAEEARFNRMCQQAVLEQNIKSLFYYSDEYLEEIWEWEPLSRVLNVFSNLYHLKKIGSDFFLASEIPDEDYEEYWDDYHDLVKTDDSKIKVINELEFYIANNESEAEYEVIVLSQKDVVLLEKEVILQKSIAKTLKDKMIAEMLEEIILLIKSYSNKSEFILAREL